MWRIINTEGKNFYLIGWKILKIFSSYPKHFPFPNIFLPFIKAGVIDFKGDGFPFGILSRLFISDL
jgi:hypothetical protein